MAWEQALLLNLLLRPRLALFSQDPGSSAFGLVYALISARNIQTSTYTFSPIRRTKGHRTQGLGLSKPPSLGCDSIIGPPLSCHACQDSLTGNFENAGCQRLHDDHLNGLRECYSTLTDGSFLHISGTHILYKSIPANVGASIKAK